MNNIASVIPEISIDSEFDYLIPDEFVGVIKVGSRVQIPFGRATRHAYVVGIKSESQCPKNKLKAIIAHDGQLINENLMRLANFIAEYYCSSKIQAIKNMLPAPIRDSQKDPKKVTKYRISDKIDLPAHIEGLQKTNPKRASILKLLNRSGSAQQSFIMNECGCSISPIKTLLKDKIIVKEMHEVQPDILGGIKIIPTENLELTKEQQQAMDTILPKVGKVAGHNTILLHGVTGCGKTELYMQSISEVIKEGREAIVLVPEISLTPQTELRFRSRFGEKVAVMHSRLSDAERSQQWKLMQAGEKKIVVGARSAIFAPFKNLGIIIVDEEHEPSYKQDKMPRYHARDIAIVRAKMEGCLVVLGSATPSFESLTNAANGRYILIELEKRVTNAKLPTIETVDMKVESLLQGGVQVFSKRLIELINKQLNSRMQTILFINRRGFATQMQCSKCSHVSECKACERPHTFHQHNKSLSCAYCGDQKLAPKSCPECGSRDLIFSGIGTEKVEGIAKKLFPRARIERMDSDTTKGKHSHREILDRVRHGEVDILIGTQMIAKGLDFPKVTLVGVMFADQGLHIPDFRASERTFQLLTQVAGRSGRGENEGRVIVQSYSPKHSAISYAIDGDIKSFYEEELLGRTIMDFPPIKSMSIVHFQGGCSATTQKTADQFHQTLSGSFQELTDDHAIKILPLIPSPMAKVRDKWRYQFSIIAPQKTMLKLTHALKHMLTKGKWPKQVGIYVDIDPQNLM